MITERSVPGWVRALDALTLVAFLLFLVAAVFGAVTMYVGPLRLSLRSSHVLFLAVAATAIRHAAHPGAAAARVALAAARRALAANLPLSAAAAAAVSRVAVLVVGYLAVLTIGFVQPATGLELSGDPLFNLPARFDAGWYRRHRARRLFVRGAIRQATEPCVLSRDAAADANRRRSRRRLAAHRAQAHAHGARVVGRRRDLVIAFAWAAHYLVRLARDTIGEPRAPAAAALMAAYPFAVFFSAPYTEALFVLGAIARVLSLPPCGMAAGGGVGPSRRTDASERLLPDARAALPARRGARGVERRAT